ncbi:uncharacterized protein [Gossypium hirsutum]|uniref:Gag-Pol polyprotein n=1 Tax=Gossypium hirsutum TaxID=3635 RepID=A0A1U8PVS1_GOSHI|nr:uncharacterized protein LOC107963189 [Gossypium hirsutum]
MSERSNKNKATQLDFGVSIRPTTSVGSVQNALKPKCKYCGKYHPSECRSKAGACYKCRAIDHFIRSKKQKEKQLATSQRSRHSSQNNATGTAHSSMKDFTTQSEATAPARSYAIRAREKAMAPSVIVGTFYLFDVIVYTLFDPGSTHFYVCTTLVTEKKFPVESTDYDIQVTNPLGQSVIVNLLCQNCPGCEFPTNLMLLPF